MDLQVKKKQKHKSKGSVRTVTKQVDVLQLSKEFQLKTIIHGKELQPKTMINAR